MSVGALIWSKQQSDDRRMDSRVNGISDTSLDAKMRLYEKDGLSLAFKPGVSLPTGDEDNWLGAGRLGYHLFLIGMKTCGLWTFLGNLGYIRNDTDSDFDEKNIWHVSAAVI
jgi:Putative MetA-pathway of phenol degradation